MGDIQPDLDAMLAETHPGHLAAVQAERQEILTTLQNTIAPQPPKAKVKKPKRSAPQVPQGLVEPVQTSISSRVPDFSTMQEPSKISKHIKQSTPIQTEWGQTPTDVRPSFEQKAKVKTRSDKSLIEKDLETMTISPDSPRASPDVDELKVIVKEKALGIFRSLFPHSKCGAKSVAWDSFVDAMSKVGFEARRSGESAVLFEPNNGSKWYGKGKIAVHRPHPDSIIDPIMLLSVGKRMKKMVRVEQRFVWARGEGGVRASLEAMVLERT
jgi:hypothetical protein